MNEWGKVVAVKGKTAVLSIPKSDECDKCKKCRPGRGEKEMAAEARNKVGARIGDTVEISDEIVSISERMFIQLSMPFIDGIIGVFVGYMIAKVFNQNTNIILWSLSVGVAFMIISYILSKKLIEEISHLKTNKLVISSIIHREE